MPELRVGSLCRILCPHDMEWEGTYIMDDDLRKMFAGLPKGCALEST